MHILSVGLAREIWFIDIRLLNPSGLAFGPIHRALIDHYQFLTYPTVPAEFDLTKGVKYGGAEFDHDGSKLAVDLAVYNNGWTADTLVSTEASDAFLNDLVRWLGENFGLQAKPEMITKVVQDSQLYFKSDIKLTEVCEHIAKFNSLLSRYSGKPGEPWALLFSSDGAPFSTFSFERRANVAFTENQYYSRASLHTSKHVQLIKEFEDMFS